MRYQLGGRIVWGADLPGNFDDGNGDELHRMRERLRAEATARRGEAEHAARIFGHVGTNVALPPAVIGRGGALAIGASS